MLTGLHAKSGLWRWSLAIAGLIAGWYSIGPVRADTPVPPPVREVTGSRLPVRGPAGDGLLAVAVSRDWSKPLPGITRAVIAVHGYHRTAVGYFTIVTRLAPDSRSLVIAPQFLAPEDVAAHGLPDTVLRWPRNHWSDGELDIPRSPPLSGRDLRQLRVSRLGSAFHKGTRRDIRGRSSGCVWHNRHDRISIDLQP